MNSKNVNNLSDKQERLLTLYYDRECNFFEKLQVKRIIKLNPYATQFLEELSKCSEIVNAEVNGMGVKDLSEFCSTLNQKIENEEHAEIFHGSRNVVVEANYSRRSNFTFLPWALSGALALALFFNINSNTSLDAVDNGLPQVVANKDIKIPTRIKVAKKRISSNENPRISNVSNYGIGEEQLEDETFDATPYLKQREYLYNPDVEVDWIRSNGSVHLIQQRNTKAPLIWISRRR